MALLDLASQARAAVSPLLTTASVVSALLLAYAAWTFWAWSRLRHVPGPLGNSLCKVWLLRASMQGRFYLSVQELVDQYGDLVRVAPHEVICSDVDELRRMSAPRSGYTRGPWYQTFRFDPECDNSFSLRDDAAHTALRARLGPGYSGTSLIEDSIDRQVARLLALVDRKYAFSSSSTSSSSSSSSSSGSGSGGDGKGGGRRAAQLVDFAKLSHLFAMDVIGDVTFGRAFGFLDEGEDMFGYIRWNEAFFPPMMTVTHLPWLTRFFFVPPFVWLFPRETDRVGIGRFMRCARDMVAQRYGPGAAEEKKKPRRDMMAVFFSNGVPEEQAISEAVLQVVAGTDSTATAIRMTLLYLISTPTAYQRVNAELAAAVDAGLISSPIREAEARRHLPYLQACIREGMRIFPGATPLIFKTVPSRGGGSNEREGKDGAMDGDVVCGYRLPPGTQVGTNTWGILRDRRRWGADADCFRPERWIEAEEAARAEEEEDERKNNKSGKGADGAAAGSSRARLEAMHTSFEVIFGFGRFKCLGRTIVFMEMNKVLPELLRRYDFAAVKAHAPIDNINNAGFWLMSGMWLRITRKEG